jgi:hypothetical protein
MLAELQRAMASIEETNRVKSVEHLATYANDAGMSATDVMEKVREQLSAENPDASPFVAWAI